MNKREHQNAVIQAVIDRHNHGTRLDYKITRWPDEEERSSRACDAYAEMAGERPIAIEHTLIQSYGFQKQRDAEFMRVLGDLESELRNTFPFRLTLTVPMFAVEKGQRWNAIKKAIKAWLLNGSTIAPGRSSVAIPGVPFAVTLFREDDAEVVFIVSRWFDNSLDISSGLTASVVAAIEDKNDQLRAYRQAGDQTILVLESDDVALVDRTVIYRAFLAAEKSVDSSNIDQVWLAPTITSENYIEVYCMQASQEFIDSVNAPNVKFGPGYSELWERIAE